MLTMREVTEDGFGKKVRAWNDKGNVAKLAGGMGGSC